MKRTSVWEEGFNRRRRGMREGKGLSDYNSLSKQMKETDKDHQITKLSFEVNFSLGLSLEPVIRCCDILT